jgi:4-hydroxybutyrate dehydrogenase/sulfolactaldehyde 3-reductase
LRKREIGYVGLGLMGGGMASHLIKNGYPMTVHDIDPEAVQRMVDLGATAAASPKEVAEKSEIVITSLPNPPIVEAAVLGADGILEGLTPGKIYIDMSTIEPETTRRVGAAVAARGAHMLDVPVGLGPAQAASGQLILMIGGEKGIVNESQDVLDTLGATQHYCGGLGAGITTKLINNLVSISQAALVGEAFTLAAKAGLDLEHMRQVMQSTHARNGHGEVGLLKTFARDFEPGFKLSLAHKDIGLAAQMANTLGVPNFVGAAVHQLQKLAIGAGLGDENASAVVKVMEETAGTEVIYDVKSN